MSRSTARSWRPDGRSRLDNLGVNPADVHTVTDVLEGAKSLTLKIEAAFMGSGSSLTVQPGTNCGFTILQIPA